VIARSLLFAVLQLATPTLPAEGFHKIGDHEGVTIYRRDSSGPLTLGGEGRMALPWKTVLAVLTDYAGQPAWVKTLAESRIIARGPGWIDVYQRLKLPVVADRDYTLHVEWQEYPDGAVLKFSTANDRGPAPTKGVVRVWTNWGSWRLQADGASTYAVYELTFDVAGSVPSWLGHGRAAKEIGVLFQSIRDEGARRAH
jgi:Polyketide cyclase / dehydrase and lipid transport